MVRGVVGRDREWGAVQSFLEDDASDPSLLLLEGEPGIGKTTLWRAGIVAATAGGYRVLVCEPDGSEAGVSLSALADLVAPIIDEVSISLPEPQRAALEIAMLRREGPAPTQFEVGRSMLSVLDACAADGLVVGIDDVQWLDDASATILNFALRRVVSRKIRLLVSRRTGIDDRLGVDRLYPIERTSRTAVGPLGVDDLAKIVREKIGVSLPRPTLLRLAEASGGNPFFALEIARNLDGRSDPRTLPIPTSLRDAVRGRLERLSDVALEVSVVASALSRPTLSTVAKAVGDPVRSDRGLAEAEDADVLRTEGTRVLFTHPLLGSTIYGSTATMKRRLLHRKLASIVDDVEEQARHLALAAEGPDEAIAAVLEEASSLALARGAPAGAAQLLERAAALTPSDRDQDRRRRVLLAARRHFDSGYAMRSREILEEAAEVFPAGQERARALTQLASVQESVDGFERAMQTNMYALEEAEGHAAQQAAIREQMAWITMGNVPVAYEHAATALELMKGVDDELQLMGVLATLAEAEFRLGMASTTDTIERALALERKHSDAMYVTDSPSASRAMQLWRLERLDEAMDFVDRCDAKAQAAGDESSKEWVLLTRGTIELRRGNAPVALEWLRAAREILLQTGMEAGDVCVRMFTALAICYLGHSEEARRTATESLRLAETTGNNRFVLHSLGAIGLCHLFDGDFEAARKHLERAHAGVINSGTVEPNFFETLVPDYAEVLVALGDYTAALEVVEPYATAGRRLERKGVIGNGARIYGLVAAAEGRMGEADALLSEAVDVLEKGASIHDLGRALSSLGIHYRRTKRKRLAREALDRAVVAFESVGAEGWADKARDELARIGGRSPGGLELTDTESQVAKLVADGFTNKEVAERLFISVRTVETNLSKVYRKLQIRSRTELVRALSGR